MPERSRGPGTTELDREKVRAEAQAERDRLDAERDRAVLDALGAASKRQNTVIVVLVAGYFIVFAGLMGVGVSGRIPGVGEVSIVQPGDRIDAVNVKGDSPEDGPSDADTGTPEAPEAPPAEAPEAP